MRRVVLFFREQFPGTAFLELDRVRLAEMRGGFDEVFRNRHLSLVIAASLGNDKRLVIHFLYLISVF